MKTQLIIIFLLAASFCRAQDSAEATRKFTLSGCIKNLETISFDKNFETSITDNLLHNRLNAKWKPSTHWTFVAELRNRLFWGESVKEMPGFAAQLRNENESINLQKTWIESRALVLHSNLERLNVEYHTAKFNARLGRQRINWGITTTWNPNDIFNAYNFLDVDYEERPGVDGARVQYTINNTSSAEFAYARSRNSNSSVAAAKYNLNRWGYDMQFISGWYKQHATLGAGWAGSIKEAGFKGEAQYFFANSDSIGHLNLSIEGDYMFKKGWYVNIGFLYNSQGTADPVTDWNAINLQLSPENLMPTKWNTMVTVAKEVTPLFSFNLGTLYAPGTKLLIIIPSLKYNLAANLDADLFWQSFFASMNTNFEAINHRCYLRLKWSF